MAFVVEDGTGLDNANSVGSVADADAYHLERGNNDWLALDNTKKQQNLIKATDYMEQRFASRVIGSRVFEEQTLSWPRQDTGVDAYDYDDETETGVVPRNWKYACFEYALRASAAPLAPDPKLDAAGVAMVTTMQKAGPVEQRFETSSGTSIPASINMIRPYPAADMYLRGLLVPSSNRTIR